jgi:hypothetical protein
MCTVGPAEIYQSVQGCAVEAIAIAAQKTNTMQTIFDKLNFPTLLPFPPRLGAKLNSPEVRGFVIGNPREEK